MSWRWTDLRRGRTPRVARSRLPCVLSRPPPAASSVPRSLRQEPWHAALMTRTVRAPRRLFAALPRPPTAIQRHHVPAKSPRHTGSYRHVATAHGKAPILFLAPLSSQKFQQTPCQPIILRYTL